MIKVGYACVWTVTVKPIHLYNECVLIKDSGLLELLIVRSLVPESSDAFVTNSFYFPFLKILIYTHVSVYCQLPLAVLKFALAFELVYLVHNLNVFLVHPRGIKSYATSHTELDMHVFLKTPILPFQVGLDNFIFAHIVVILDSTCYRTHRL